MNQTQQTVSFMLQTLDSAYLSRAWAAKQLGCSTHWLAKVTKGHRDPSSDLLDGMLNLAHRIKAAGFCIKSQGPTSELPKGQRN